MMLIRNLVARVRNPQPRVLAPTELAEAAHALRFVDRTAEERLLARERVHAYSRSFNHRY